MPHATLWFPENVRKAATSCYGAPRARAELERGCTPCAGVGRLGLPMAASLAGRGRGGLGPQTCDRAAAQTDCPALRTAGANLGARGQGAWFRQRVMDLTAHRRRDSGAFWRALSSLTRLEGVTRLGLELSGAGAPGHPARRAGDCALEALQVAGD
jgi:hypothetical protein